VIGLRSVVTFQGRTPDELESSFRESADLYLEMCKEDGVPPEKPYSGRFNVSISPELHREIALKSAMEHKSLNKWVSETLYKSL
jgi:predicted HicB family RNase H-like nuclease